MRTITLMEAMARFPEGKWEMYSPFRQGPQGIITNHELLHQFGEACDEGMTAFMPENPVQWGEDDSVHLIRPDGQGALLIRLVEPGRIRVSPEKAKRYAALVGRVFGGEDVESELEMLEEEIVEENLWRRG